MRARKQGFRVRHCVRCRIAGIGGLHQALERAGNIRI